MDVMKQPWALDYEATNCSVAAAVAVIGEKWTFLVLREAFMGVRRFADMQRRTGAPRQILSDRLARLVTDGLLSKVPYREQGQRARQEYRLTTKGMDLYPILVALMQWGDRNATPAAGPYTLLIHRDCGAPVGLELTCADGHRLDSARDVTPLPGPGARKLAQAG
jgi:DNA-binding HxlR family transcriptional regulator